MEGKTMDEEARNFLNVGFIREVQYTTWLANVVMVKKPNGKWTICTNYIDLNKACPKDSYPLLSIDRLVNGASKFLILNFFGVYSRYNHISMFKQDKQKTSFMIDTTNYYYYSVMPFDLENARATYQRLMDKIFTNQLGRNLEVYVDDMMVKSRSTTSHAEDLAKIFVEIRKYYMRLNP